MAGLIQQDTVMALRQRLMRTGRLSRALVLFVAGALSATALPPLHLVILLIPAFVVLFWATDDAVTPGRAFRVGWLFGVGHFAVGFYWVGYAFLVDAAQYGWMAPFAVLGMACGLALFVALVSGVSRWIYSTVKLAPVGRVMVFAGIWIVVEWLRGWVLTGFPWNLIGSVWVFSDAMVQFAALGGVLGLGLVTLIAALLPAVLADPSGPPMTRRWIWPLAGFAVLIIIAGFGMLRLSTAETTNVEGVRLRLVQPNVPQHLKWQADLRMGHVRKLAKLSVQPPQPGWLPPTHLIWPETAVPFNMQHSPNLLAGLSKIVPPSGALLTGAPRSDAPVSATPSYWNSLLVLGPDADIRAVYDKRHLVPFGEYVPWRSLLSLTKLTEGRTDFSIGKTARTIALKGLPEFAPLICYEAIFTSEVRELGLKPKWLLNITNDAWFGQSAGPYQHLAAVRFRAVEMGLPLARVANTGISAMVDPYGRIMQQLPLGGEGVLDVPLPTALEAKTLYGRFGDLLVFLMIGACLLLARLMRQ